MVLKPNGEDVHDLEPGDEADLWGGGGGAEPTMTLVLCLTDGPHTDRPDGPMLTRVVPAQPNVKAHAAHTHNRLRRTEPAGGRC